MFNFLAVTMTQGLEGTVNHLHDNKDAMAAKKFLQGGSDVITKTALKRINWAAYKINQGTDKIGVFVSIVSTKIPYKGAGKEYIGQPFKHFYSILHWNSVHV